MTRKTGHSSANDPGLNALINTASSAVCIVGKTSLFHVNDVLNISKEENLRMIKESIEEILKKIKKQFLMQSIFLMVINSIKIMQFNVLRQPFMQAQDG